MPPPFITRAIVSFCVFIHNYLTKGWICNSLRSLKLFEGHKSINIIEKVKFSMAGNRKDCSPKHSRATFSSLNLNCVGAISNFEQYFGHTAILAIMSLVLVMLWKAVQSAKGQRICNLI